MTRAARNNFICQYYVEGSTQEELANQFHLTKVRIGQILRELGLTKHDRLKSNRTAYVAVHLLPAVKDALRQEAANEETSMSEFISKAIEEELGRRGVDIKPVLDEREVLLPL